MDQSSREREKRRATRIARTRLAVAALGAACVACGDSTAPPRPDPDEVCPSAPVPLCNGANAVAVAAARDGASDAAGRSVSALDNAAARAALASRLTQLESALAAGNVTRGREALRQSREALAAARGQLTAFPGDAADLAAIELALDQVALLLGTS
jgi:hypothetical protein